MEERGFKTKKGNSGMRKEEKTTIKKQSVTSKEIPKPKEYHKPELFSEKLLAFAASCNGSPGGGRKATVAGPVNFCQANRLNS